MSFVPVALRLNLLAVATAFVATALLLPIVGRLARRVGAVDVPDRVRRLHGAAVPRLGGAAVFLGAMVAVGVVLINPLDADALAIWAPFGERTLAVASGALFVLAAGLLDDVSGLSALVKLFMQCLAASFVVGAGLTVDAVTLWNGGPSFDLGPVGVPITLLWIVGVTNAFNLIDGIDGLAVVCALVALCTLVAGDMILGGNRLFLLSSALVGALLAFRRVNRHPAQMFLGDSGSMTLGFFFAVRSLEAGRTTDGALFALLPLTALAYPLFDTVSAMARRTALGTPISRADMRHVHHQLLARGYTVPSVVRRIAATSGVVGAVGVTAAALRGPTAAALTATVSLATLLGVPLLWQWLGYAELSTPKTLCGQIYLAARRNLRAVWPVLLTAAFAALVLALFAGTRPLSAQQAGGASGSTRPTVSAGWNDASIRQQLQESGLTPAQLRARLAAAGYPSSLLDRYLDGAGSAGGVRPVDDLAAVLRAIGVDHRVDLDELVRSRRADGVAPNAEPMVAGGRTPLRDSRTIFGLALFRSSTSQFFPNLDGPVDASYRLGPGDQLVLILTGDVEAAYTLDVTREGFVVVPNVGQIAVASLTLGDVEQQLQTRLSRSFEGVGRGEGARVRFSVSVARLRSNQVFVTGDVVTPGSYRVTSAGTVLTALYAAGGPTDDGSLRRVEVRRAGRVVGALDVYAYLLRGDASQDIRLQQGDVVFVPVRGARVRVDGAVTRPATYELTDGETLHDVLRAAGGALADADGRRVVIERILPLTQRAAGRDRVVLDVAMDSTGAPQTVPMADGDIVTVPVVADRLRGRIAVRGHVWREGVQGYSSGMTLADALRRAGGVQPDAYWPVVHVARLRADSTRVQLRASLIDSTGATRESLLLQEDDEIMVYSRTTFRGEREVSIAGAVRAPGRRPWRDGMTLRDLVLMAGGLTEDAWLQEAEIARRPDTPSSDVAAETMRIPLDSSYRFETGRSPTDVTPEIPLHPGDHVLLLRDPEWQKARIVVITGAVRFPGRYTLRTRGERVSDLLQRAGGVTRVADVDGSYFARFTDPSAVERLVRAERQRSAAVRAARVGFGGRDSMRAAADSLPVRPGASEDSLAAVAIGAEDVAARFRVGVDVKALLKRPSRGDNLLLMDGDSLHVPERQYVVSVRGAVNAPSALAYEGSRSLGHYVRAAGGITDAARVRRAYVIQPNGRIESRRHVLWVVPVDPRPRPGATVVVPSRDEARERGSVLQSVSIVTQLVASLAAIVALTR